MGQRDLHRADAVGLAELLDLAVDEELGLAQRVVDDLDLGELVAARPARAHGLEEGLLGGKAGGEVLGRPVLGLAVGDLGRGEELGLEAFRADELLLHPLDLDDVRSGPENQRLTRLSSGNVSSAKKRTFIIDKPAKMS